MKYKTIAVAKKLTLWSDSVTEVSCQLQLYRPTVPVEGGIFEMDNDCPTQQLLCQHMPKMIDKPAIFKDREWLRFRTLLQKNVYEYLQSCDTAPPLDYASLHLDTAAAWASEQKPFVEFCIARWYQKLSDLKDRPPI